MANGQNSNFEIVLQADFDNNFDAELDILTLGKLFEFLHSYYGVLNKNNFKDILPFIHNCLIKWAENGEYLNSGVDDMLCNFLKEYLHDETDLVIVLPIVHQVLTTLKSLENHKEINIDSKVFLTITKFLPVIKCRKLVANTIACLQLYMQIYPGKHHEVIKTIWSDLYQKLLKTHNQTNTICLNTEIDILTQLFDDFYEINPIIYDDPVIAAIVKYLLKSEQKEERKFGNYLLQKMIHYLVINSQNIGKIWLTTHNSQTIENLWKFYINILKNLEEEQSDFVVASLRNFKELIKSKQLQETWLDILYKRLLKHKNLEILFSSLSCILESLTISDLSAKILKLLLESTNSMLLYNSEGYFLSTELFIKFLKGDLKPLYVLLGEIEWNSIPLYIWINALQENENELSLETSIDFKQVLKLSSKVQNIKNRILRKKTLITINKLFKQIVDKMSMTEYVLYVETLYQTTDTYGDFEIFYEKTTSLNNTTAKDFFFKKHIYELFLKNMIYTETEVNKFIKFLHEIPEKYHGWFKFIPYHFYRKISIENEKVLNNLYKIDLKHPETRKLTELIFKFEEILKPKLLATDDDGKKESYQHCRAAAIAIYIQRFSLGSLDDETLKILYTPVLTKEKCSILWTELCDSLKYTDKIIDTWIIDAILERIQSRDIYDVGDKILKYLSKTYDDDTKTKYYEIILDKYPNVFYKTLSCYTNPLKLSNQKRFFNGDLHKGDSRIEQLFINNTSVNENAIDLMYIWDDSLSRYGDTDYILFLLNCHKEISLKTPIYEEYSIEHRVKLRIAVGVTQISKYIFDNKVFKRIWDLLLTENNQLNICLIYEHILVSYGSFDTRNEMILEKLKEAHTLETSKQQITIISVAYNFFRRSYFREDATKETFISNFLALTMSANTETRVFAQMVIYKLLNCKSNEQILRREQILETIEIVLKPNLNEYIDDLRLYMEEDEFSDKILRIILFVTKVSYDPSICYYCLWSPYCGDEFISSSIKPETKEQIMKCRSFYLKTYAKKSLIKDQDDYVISDINLFTYEDIFVPNDLIVYHPNNAVDQKSINNDIIVVASLLNNSKYLESIIHSCEISGIKNLIVTKDKMKNIQATSLDIIAVNQDKLKQYLMNKQQLEDFKIIAAHSICNYFEDITNFVFPQKCILLLGHEVYGVPVHLLDILDYNVKMSRKSNVSQVAAFCMWKYSEQHLIG